MKNEYVWIDLECAAGGVHFPVAPFCSPLFTFLAYLRPLDDQSIRTHVCDGLRCLRCVLNKAPRLPLCCTQTELPSGVVHLKDTEMYMFQRLRVAVSQEVA